MVTLVNAAPAQTPVRRSFGPAADRSFMPPCQDACPLHMQIREYVDLVAQGKVMEALQVIRDGNPFPSVCAYVCAHPCEDACRRGQVDTPIAIRALKRFAVEFGGEMAIHARTKTTQTEKVAIIGSGPAGLSCAYYLRRLGYEVTVFEAHAELGGMLRVGIPRYRLPRKVLDTEVRNLMRMGVEVRTGVRVQSLDLLRGMGYQAIFLGLGAHQSRRLRIEGEDASGVVDAVALLREVNLGLKPPLGDSVVVAGGGNVAVDAARTAVRLDAKKVNLFCLESRAEMPAFEDDVRAAEEEGIKINCGWGPKTIQRGKRVTGVEFKRCTSVFDANGRFSPSYDEETTTSVPADSVIIAIGQAPQIPDDFQLQLSRGTIKVDPVTLISNRDGIFAGGDAVTGPASAVQALAYGRRAAFRIHEYLRHLYPLPEKPERDALTGDLLPETVEMIKKLERVEPPERSPEARVQDFATVEQVYDWEVAAREARRCLSCGNGAEIAFQDRCASCLTCVRVCPYHVPKIDAEGAVQIPPDQCQACGVCAAECPARAIFLRRAQDGRHITAELDELFASEREKGTRPLIVGFCCQYGFYGSGVLSGLWRGFTNASSMVPVQCLAKLEAEHLLRPFEMGAEGVFVAGCGDRCGRANTGVGVLQHIHRVRKTLGQMGLEGERVQGFGLLSSDEDPVKALEAFAERVAALHLKSVMSQEVRS